MLVLVVSLYLPEDTSGTHVQCRTKVEGKGTYV